MGYCLRRVGLVIKIRQVLKSKGNKSDFGISVPVGLVAAFIRDIEKIPLVDFDCFGSRDDFAPSGEHICKIMAGRSGAVIGIVEFVEYHGAKSKAV